MNLQHTSSQYIVYRWIQRSVRIKRLPKFLKSDHLHIVWWGILFWATLYMHYLLHLDIDWMTDWLIDWLIACAQKRLNSYRRPKA